jgi:hypothetical protein
MDVAHPKREKCLAVVVISVYVTPLRDEVKISEIGKTCDAQQVCLII